MRLIKYFGSSCLATVVDVWIVWLLNTVLGKGIVLANTMGVVIGFLISYVLTSRFVFKEANNILGFGIFLSTFLLGLILADVLIYIGVHQLFNQYNPNVRFLLSKSISIVIPFFMLYFIRKSCYSYIEKRNEVRR